MIYKKTNKRMSELVDEEPIINDEAAGLEQATLAGKKCAPRKKGGLLLVILVVALLWYVLGAYTGLALPGFSKMRPSDDWQAIFLNNGQVYFGKIKNVTSRELVLTNIYYLQVITSHSRLLRKVLLTSEQNQQTQQELTLIKLGNELHGPTDKMVINRDYILLTEALKNDSQVVKAIDASLAK